MEPEQKSNGALIGSIIIVIILILGGLYLLKTNWNKSEDTNTAGEVMLDSEGAPSTINVETDTTELEQELNNLDLEGLDSDL